jgi:integrase
MAQYFAHAMWIRCEEVFAAVRQDQTLTPAQIDQMIGLYLADCRNGIEADKASLSPNVGDASRRRLIDIHGFAGLGAEIRRRAENNDIAINTEAVADLATRVGATIPPGSLDERLATRALGRALGDEYLRVAHSHANELTGPLGFLMRSKLRIFNPAPDSETISVATRPSSGSISGVPGKPPTAAGAESKATASNAKCPVLTDAFAEFLDRQINTRKEMPSDRRREFESTCSVVTWILGDKPLDEYDDDDMKRFEKEFLALANDYKNFRADGDSLESTKKKIENARETIPFIQDANKRLIIEERLKTINPKTFNKHISNFKAVLVAKKLKNITEGYHIWIDKSKKARRAERDAAKFDDIKRLSEAPYWTGRRSAYHVAVPGNVIIRDAMYWTPLLCVHHGLRIEEAAQLRRRHFRYEIAPLLGMILCIDLANDPSLKLKNTNAERPVPLHDAMFILGFDIHLAQFGPDDLIFPELSNDNAHETYGADLEKRYGRMLREVFDRATAKRLTHQSLRHFVATTLGNTEFKDSWVNELMGHEGVRVSEAERYNKGLYVQNLKRMIDAIELPIDYAKLRELADESARRQNAKPKPKRKPETKP